MTSVSLSGGGSPSEKNTLVEFGAGKMTMENKIFHADKRRGIVYMYLADDFQMHFCWKDCETGVVEDDLILFPGDAIFERVPECTTGRVYVMIFKASSKRFFYYLQESKTDNDDEFCRKVNHYLKHSFSRVSSQTDRMNEDSASSRSGSFPISGLSSLDNRDLQSIINNMSHQQSIQLLNEVEGLSRELISNSAISNELSDLRSFTGASQPSEKSQTLNDSIIPSASDTDPSDAPDSFDTIHSSVSPDSSGTPDSSETSDSSESADSSETTDSSDTSDSSETYIDLSSVITAEVLQPLIDNNKDLISRVEKFLPPLPDTDDEIPQERLKSTMQSDEFKFDLEDFGEALQLGQLGSLMKEFRLSSEIITAADSGDLEAFVKALQSSTEEGTTESIPVEVKELDKDSDKHSN